MKLKEIAKISMAVTVIAGIVLFTFNQLNYNSEQKRISSGRIIIKMPDRVEKDNANSNKKDDQKVNAMDKANTSKNLEVQPIPKANSKSTIVVTSLT